MSGGKKSSFICTIEEFIKIFPDFTESDLEQETLNYWAEFVKNEVEEEFTGNRYKELCLWLLAHKLALVKPIELNTYQSGDDNPLLKTKYGLEYMRILDTISSSLPDIT